MDVWSAGCIFAEMILRRQLFPGKDGVSQVKMIVYYLGTPEKQVITLISSLKGLGDGKDQFGHCLRLDIQLW